MTEEGESKTVAHETPLPPSGPHNAGPPLPKGNQTEPDSSLAALPPPAYPNIYEAMIENVKKKEAVWYLTSTITGKRHKRLGSKLDQAQGGITLYTIEFCITDSENPLHLTEKVFQRQRRYTSFRELRTSLISAINTSQYVKTYSAIEFPKKNVMKFISNRAKNIDMRSKQLGKWLQTVMSTCLGPDGELAHKTVLRDWLTAPDSGEGSPAALSKEQISQRRLILSSWRELDRKLKAEELQRQKEAKEEEAKQKRLLEEKLRAEKAKQRAEEAKQKLDDMKAKCAAYTGPMSTPTDEQLITIYGPDGPQLRAMAIATHIYWGIKWWDDWTSPLPSGQNWNQLMEPNFRAHKIEWEAVEPPSADEDTQVEKYAPQLQRIVGLGFGWGYIERNSEYSKQQLTAKVFAIPDEIFAFPHCKKLEDLGDILRHYPKTRQSLDSDCFAGLSTSLETLNIGYHEGSIPQSLSDCISLRKLKIEWCKNIAKPLDVSKLTNLTVLNSWANGMAGFVGCASLSKLVELTLSESSRENSILMDDYPSGLDKLSNLRKLTLGLERVKTIPPSLFEGKHLLEDLSFSDYATLGKIPDTMYDLSSLKKLSFFQCGGKTEEPIEWSNRIGTLTSLQSLSYTGSQPTFTIHKKLRLTHLPSSISNLTALTSLRVSRAAIDQ